MNIESKLWKVVSYNDAYAHITQKASGVMRTVSASSLSFDELASVSEKRFDKILREAFHSAATKGA